MRWFSTVLGVLSACTGPVDADDTGSEEDTGQSSWTEEELFTAGPAPIDVLMPLDGNEPTTAEFLEAAPFLFTSLDAHGADWRVGTVSIAMEPTDAGTLHGVIDSTDEDPVATLTLHLTASPVGYEQPFDAVNAVLTEPLASGANAGFRRANARLAVVYVHKEDDQSEEVGPAQLTETLLSLVADPSMVTFSALVGPEDTFCMNSDAQLVADPAPRIWEVVTATGGIGRDYCADDWGTFMADVGALSEGAARVYVLDGAPEPGNLQVLVDDIEVAPDMTSGFSWDVERSAVVLHGAAVPEVGASVRVRY